MNQPEYILKNYRTIAVVGLSPDPSRPSFGVASYMARHGYRIIPVNPREKEILGLPCYPDLAAIPGDIEVVDIFRRSEDVGPIVDEAVRLKAKAVWMQLGVVNEPAAVRAREAGLLVVMDRCMMQEHVHLR
ncbi:MAG: CoA-binding protein [Chloroflexi bacterium]|nr:CoA-binding protein [Chloroflexota bacterium]